MCTNGYIFNFFCNYFSSVKKFYLKSIQYSNWLHHLVWWLNKIFRTHNIIVNYHILIIHNWSGYGYFNFHFNWQIFVRCWAYNMKWIAVLNYFIWEKYVYFCDILIKIKLFAQNVQPKNPFGCSESIGCSRFRHGGSCNSMQFNYSSITSKCN